MNLPASPDQTHITVQAPRTNGLAIASLVCGICGFLYLIPAVLGIVFGYVAHKQIGESSVPVSGKGMATAGMVCGAAWLALFAILILSAISQ